MATVGPLEVWGFPSVWGGGDSEKKLFLRGLVMKIRPKYMICGTSGVVLGDLGRFWCDLESQS